MQVYTRQRYVQREVKRIVRRRRSRKRQGFIQRYVEPVAFFTLIFLSAGILATAWIVIISMAIAYINTK